MQTSLYSITVPIFIKNLQNMSGFIDKTLLHSAESGEVTDANALLEARLAPDQFPFVKQVQVACDNAKAFTARLNGNNPVPMEDTETTMEELKQRIDKTIALLKEIKPEDVDGKEDAKVEMKYFPDQHFTGFGYATEYILPNFFFHMTTAYAILRHNGINLGKSDFMGSLPLQNNA